jgi:hypothetical protein
MARDAVVACRGPVAVGLGGLDVMLMLVVEDERRFAVVLMEVMRERAERGHAQRHEQHLRGHAQQPRRDSQHDAHSHSVSGDDEGVKTGRRRTFGRAGLRPKSGCRSERQPSAGVAFHPRTEVSRLPRRLS